MTLFMPPPLNKQSTQSIPFGGPSDSVKETSGDGEFFIRQAFEQSPRMGYELLFRRYYQPLHSHATRLVYSPDYADDIVSDVFLNFWLMKAYLNVTTSYQAYLLVSVRRAAYAHMRREFIHETIDKSEVQQVSDQAPVADILLSYDELYLSIDRAIRALPPQMQRVFMLSRFDGKSHREIAEQLRISPRTVEVHIHRVLRILRGIVADQ